MAQSRTLILFNSRKIGLLSYLFLIISTSTFATETEPHVAQRIITLSPHATELAFSAGLGEHIVGVSQASDYPPAAKDIEQVATYQGIKLERILALQPDLVIAWRSNAYARELEKLQQFGIPVYYSSIDSLDDIATNIKQLSQYAEDPSIGLNNAKQFQQQLDSLRQHYHTRSKVRYFYQLSDRPMMSFSSPHWPSDVFSVCGGDNIVTNQNVPYPQISHEQVIVLKPQVIFTSQQQANMSRWQQWPQIPAVEHHFIWSLNPDWISRPTMRSLKAVKQVCRFLDKARLK